MTGGLILLVKINKMKQKYFQIIKYIYAQKFNKHTRFSMRKRKILKIHRQSLKTCFIILCISEAYLNLRQAPFEQMQHSSWNIAYTYTK